MLSPERKAQVKKAARSSAEARRSKAPAVTDVEKAEAVEYVEKLKERVSKEGLFGRPTIYFDTPQDLALGVQMMSRSGSTVSRDRETGGLQAWVGGEQWSIGLAKSS